MASAERPKPDVTASRAPRGPADRKDRLRIIHVINALGPGGAESLLYRLILRDRANDHSVVSLGKAAWYSSRLEERGIRVHHLDIHSAVTAARGALELTRIMRASGADVVQCWMYRSNVFGGVAARAAGKPVVWGIHHATISTMRWRSRALAVLGGILARWMADYVINCSRRSEEIHRQLGYSSASGSVVNNGYDPGEFFPDEEVRTATRETMSVAPDRFVIGSISRWHREKDIPNLLKAVRIARARDVPLLCLLVGAGLGEQNARLASLIRSCDRAGLVVPLGLRSDVQDLSRAFDLHVLASCSEAFPSVVAETMLSGTPNAVTDVGDTAWMVGGSGWVVPARNPELLASAIVDSYREFKCRPERWKARRDSGREGIAEDFSLDRMIGRYSTIWREVAGRMQRQSEVG